MSRYTPYEAPEKPMYPMEPTTESEEQKWYKKNGNRRKRLRRKDMSPAERRKRRIKDWIITACVFGTIGLFVLCCEFACLGNVANLEKLIASFDAVQNDFEMVSAPTNEANKIYLDNSEGGSGYYTFVTDDDFKVLQFTDIHIGAGAFSLSKDRQALNAVRTVVEKAKPDFIIVTGDAAYPVPFQAGTFNNKTEARVLASLFEELGVYWTIAFGNHDAEIYSLYTREEIADYYMLDQWTYCLFNKGPEDIDGFCNDIFIVKGTDGKMKQALVIIDSHSYTNGDYFGIAWSYDFIHQNQIDWYKAEMEKLAVLNGGEKLKNMVYFHIPLFEYGDAWTEFKNNGYKNTEDVKYFWGKFGEKDEKSYPGVENSHLFDALLEYNCQGTFCGHDHYNIASIEYKGIRLTYGMSIDCLAYAGIQNEHWQRGGTLATIAYEDGKMKITPVPENYDDASELIIFPQD